MTLSIDTNVFVDVIRGRNLLVRNRFFSALAGSEPLAASLIVFHELFYGAEVHARREAQHESVRLLLDRVTVQPLETPDVIVAARIRTKLRSRGEPIGAFDSLIAGQALARDWTVVTANTREFQRIEGLKVIDWTFPAD